MQRRLFLKLAAGSSPLIAGCASQPGQTPRTEDPTEVFTSRTDTSPSTDAASNTIYVGPDGKKGGDGSEHSPVKTIQEALELAQPGNTIYVKAGQYFESPRTKRPGEPDKPITITGPPEAVISGVKQEGYTGGFGIGHSHIHIAGTTINGLQNPSKPDDATSYMDMAVNCLPRNNEYLTDLVIKPHAIGNTRGSMVDLNFVENVEVGEFRLIGPSGLDYLLGNKIGHFGEIVYVGSPPGATFNAIERQGELAGDIDSSNGVYIHHIDNSAGHGHIELVDIKAGSQNVTVEYCTSVDARLPSDNDHSTAVHIGGHDVTFRWNRIVSPADRGVDIGNYAESIPEFPHPDAPDAGTNNSVYGNEFKEMNGLTINYTSETSEDKQRSVCGNTIDGETDGNPTRDCPDDIPETDSIGHLGGDSPWT